MVDDARRFLDGDPIRTVLIGCGRIAREDHVPALLASRDVDLVAVCDPDVGALESLPASVDVPTFTSIEALLAEIEPEAAMLALPHDQYLDTIAVLVARGIHVLKEKPLAVDLAEARAILQLANDHRVKLGVTTQRRYNPMFVAFNQLRKHIGVPFHFDFRYTLAIPNLEYGWRASKERAGGGCLLDMGYHVIDLLTWYFGLPNQVEAVLQRSGRPGQSYDVEDTCSLRLHYQDREQDLAGNVFISRVYPHKEERLTLVGSEGMVVLERHELTRLNVAGDVEERLVREGEWPSAYLDQLETFARWIRNDEVPQSMSAASHLVNVAMIDAGYRAAETRAEVDPMQLLREQFPNAIRPE